LWYFIWYILPRTIIMPKIVRPLSVSQVKNAKPKDKLYKLSDGGGLALWVLPSGGESWGNGTAQGAVGGGGWGYYLASLFLPPDSFYDYHSSVIPYPL